MGTSHAETIEARLKDAAFAQMAEEGVAGLDVRAICVRARAPLGAFHERWPDAWGAFLEAFDERARLPVLPDTGALAQDLIAYVRDYMAFCADRSHVAVLFYLMAQWSRDEAVRARVAPGFVARRRRNMTLIRRAVARGELPADVDGNAILDSMLTLALSYMGREVSPPTDEELRRPVDEAITRAKASAPWRRRSGAPRAGAADAYRLFLIEPSGERQLTEAEPLRARSERRAIADADARRRGRYAELWKGGRLIRVFDPD